ncbi:MAG: hypothetical protein QOH71_3909 [Blastocatellia bacterium]|jgi:hypothetical protein|nr:hypothetical protein [Blastocatellia bacterium]
MTINPPTMIEPAKRATELQNPESEGIHHATRANRLINAAIFSVVARSTGLVHFSTGHLGLTLRPYADTRFAG